MNISRIVRVAGCLAIPRLIACGATPRVDRRIARQAADCVQVVVRRTLPPVLCELRQQGYRIVGLEQTTGAENLFDFRFERQTALVFGNERSGLADEILELLDAVVEIPVFGLPFSYNVASAVTMALYEYARQFPDG